MNNLRTRYIVNEQGMIVEEIDEFDDNEPYEKEKTRLPKDELDLIAYLSKMRRG